MHSTDEGATDLRDTCPIGDCRKVMRRLIETGLRVQMCVTSPPYWGLRDYGCEGQIGLERTPDEYVAVLVEVFGLVRELLSADGTVWLNLGDCYATGAGKACPELGRRMGECPGGGIQGERWKGHRGTRPPCSKHARGTVGPMIQPNRLPLPGLKPKDLIGIPWRVAFALQADGWTLRSDIIWHKPNPMPESVKDRPTRAHEYLFLFSQSERYYYDHKAIRERASGKSLHDLTGQGYQAPGQPKQTGDRKPLHGPIYSRHRSAIPGGQSLEKMPDQYRSKRSVWSVPTIPFLGSHFATFPPALIEPCILAGSRPGDIVLDPFLGSGTAAEVAQRLGRHWLGIELNPHYTAMQERRTAQRALALQRQTEGLI